MKALLIGNMPSADLGFSYTAAPPYDGVVIGSLTLSQALGMRDERILQALAEGRQVVLYTPGLPKIPRNRALAASMTSSCREMKNWGIRFTDGAGKRLVTAEDARALRQAGQKPAPGSVLTPLAKEILEGTT